MENLAQIYQDFINDPVFNTNLEKEMNQFRVKRSKRPDPQPGMHYVRDWYNRMSEAGTFRASVFKNEIILICKKESSLSSEFRKAIALFCGIALTNTIEHYKLIAQVEETDKLKSGHTPALMVKKTKIKPPKADKPLDTRSKIYLIDPIPYK